MHEVMIGVSSCTVEGDEVTMVAQEAGKKTAEEKARQTRSPRWKAKNVGNP
jgi:hypothetical protein